MTYKYLALIFLFFFVAACGVKGPPKPRPSKESSDYTYDADYLSTTAKDKRPVKKALKK